MADFLNKFWQLKLEKTKDALEKNNFEVVLAQNEEEAKKVVLEQMIPDLRPQSVSWGGSLTFIQTGLYHALRESKEFEIIDTYQKGISKEQALENRRKALLVDLFFSGTNAITEQGWLVNLDMIGNRVAALTFGPKKVVVLAGQNKIVPDLATAQKRIKNYSAPANTMRLQKKNPCLTTGYCHDCKSEERICNVWTIQEKCFPKQRICIILIAKDMGL